MKKNLILKEAIERGLLKTEGMESKDVEMLLDELDKKGYVMEKVPGENVYLVDKDEFLD